MFNPTDIRAIAHLVETGDEHVARERYGDVVVDDYFRGVGVDPDAARDEQPVDASEGFGYWPGEDARPRTGRWSR